MRGKRHLPGTLLANIWALAASTGIGDRSLSAEQVFLSSDGGISVQGQLDVNQKKQAVSTTASEDATHFRNPKVWGPAAWFFLHSVTLSQPSEISDTEQQKRLQRFFTEDLSWLLPCPACGEHARDHLKAMEKDTPSTTWTFRSQLVKFVSDLHNRVNDQLNKESVPLKTFLAGYSEICKQTPPVSVYLPSQPTADFNQDSLQYSSFKRQVIWGPPSWFFFHSISLSQAEPIPQEQQARLKRFFTQDMSWLLPCPGCGVNSRKHLASMTIPNSTWASRTELARWLVSFHNLVNIDTKKEVVPWEKALQKYSGAFAKGPPVDVHFQDKSGTIRCGCLHSLLFMLMLLASFSYDMSHGISMHSHVLLLAICLHRLVS